MSKGKYKRKHERARQEEGEGASEASLPNSEGVTGEKPPKSTAKGDQNGCKEREHSMSLRETIKRSSFTDWCIAAFTLVLTVVAIYQTAVIEGQLETMRIDQRAWLKVGGTPDKPGDDHASWKITSGQPVVYPLRVTNSGKTPAANMDMSVFVEIVDADKEPSLEYVDTPIGHPHGHATSGIVFPNVDIDQPVIRPSDDAGPRVATDDEVRAVKDGKAYMAVYGIVRYDDVFQRHRWTKFCIWSALTGTFQAKSCTQYNSADRN